MSLLSKFAAFVLKNRVRPSHIDDLVTWLTGESEDAYTVLNQTSAKAALTTLQDTRVDTFETANDVLIAAAVTAMESYVNANSTGETINASATDLKAAVAGYINAIAPDYANLKIGLAADVSTGITTIVSVNKTTILGAIKTEYLATRDLYEVDSVVYFQYNDPKCKGIGRHAYNIDPDTDQTITTPIHCNSCDGFGKTNVQNIATTTFSVTETIPET